MKNIINYYYNLNINSITVYNDKYIVKVNNDIFLFEKCNRSLEEVNELYYISNSLNNNLYSFVLNIYNNLVTDVDGSLYVLFHLNCFKNRNININDLLTFNYYGYNNLISRVNWSYLWGLKIDSIEILLNNNRVKYAYLNDCIDYFVGVAESSIMLYNECILPNNLYLSHYRVSESCDLLAFNDPLNIVIDYRVRDIAEFIKGSFYNGNRDYNELFSYLEMFRFDYNDLKLFFARLLFPSFIFDDIDNDKINFANIAYDYNDLISYFYMNLYNIGVLPEIEWIKKVR